MPGVDALSYVPGVGALSHVPGRCHALSQSAWAVSLVRCMRVRCSWLPEESRKHIVQACLHLVTSCEHGWPPAAANTLTESDVLRRFHPCAERTNFCSEIAS